MKEKEARENLKSLPTFSNSNWIHKPSASVGYLEAVEKAKGLGICINGLLSYEDRITKSPMVDYWIGKMKEIVAKWEKEI